MLKIETAVKASYILVNSFDTLDAFQKEAGPLASKMKYIGPCLPSEVLEPKPSNDDTGPQETFSKENEGCLTWLDSQASHSVLFMAFGSLASLPPDQIEQIALGIEESKLKFLWVVPPGSAGRSPVPEGFAERTKEQGRIIPWAQQLQVLQHPATGGFMTHCGWNSTLESISMGVPLLCLPLCSDQPINGYLIAKQWKVGVAMEKGRDGKVWKDEVERSARCLMEGEETQALRKRTRELQEAARQALREGGSSSQALRQFLEALHERNA